MALHAAEEGAGQAVDLAGGPSRRRRVRVEWHGRALDRLGQEVVERSEDVAALRVVAVRELVRLLDVADGAVARRDDRRDVEAVVVVAVGVVGLRLVALHAADSLLGVGAAAPVLDDARVRLLVAFDALDGGRRRHDAGLPQAGLLGAADGLQPLYEDQGQQEHDAKATDEDALRLESQGWTSMVSVRREPPTASGR